LRASAFAFSLVTQPALIASRVKNTSANAEERALLAGPSPTGFGPPVQGCEVGQSGSDRDTLGNHRRRIFNPNGVVAWRRALNRHNPVGVEIGCALLTQGSSFLATLGCRTSASQRAESLWDSWKGWVISRRVV
jgi:hypothetical protein